MIDLIYAAVKAASAPVPTSELPALVGASDQAAKRDVVVALGILQVRTPGIRYDQRALGWVARGETS